VQYGSRQHAADINIQANSNLAITDDQRQSAHGSLLELLSAHPLLQLLELLGDFEREATSVFVVRDRDDVLVELARIECRAGAGFLHGKQLDIDSELGKILGSLASLVAQVLVAWVGVVLIGEQKDALVTDFDRSEMPSRREPSTITTTSIINAVATAAGHTSLRTWLNRSKAPQ
jgi:hypothetical protein